MGGNRRPSRLSRSSLNEPAQTQALRPLRVTPCDFVFLKDQRPALRQPEAWPWESAHFFRNMTPPRFISEEPLRLRG